jgi:hypothetical protein
MCLPEKPKFLKLILTVRIYSILHKQMCNKCLVTLYLIVKIGWLLVAHTCNPSYSEGRDQEESNLRPAPAK